VEWKGAAILFDTGQNAAFVKNAHRLGVDLNEVDYCVISHAHYDHGGGLKAFFRRNPHAQVYLKPACREQYFARITGNRYKAIGLDLKLLEKHRTRFRYADTELSPSPGVLLLPPEDFRTFKPRGNSRLFMFREKEYREDIFDHELMMVLHDEENLVLFTGCAHSGILNMIKTVQQKFPGRTITAVLGGFHLMLPTEQRPGETEEDIRFVGETLADMKIGEIYTGHCTGSRAFPILQSVLGNKLNKLTSGLSVY
jgi:7,8-dihydropterin-6-yl-methyl-4-(beta-D-ribofuranosyl)aminobenzene 5'-phosphate synthase